MVEERRRRRAGSWVALLIAGILVSGCQTARSFQHGCPGIYSGVRFYGDQISTVPFDGKLFFTIDLPLTAVADTLMVPFTAFADRRVPPAGFPPGCRWAGGYND